MAKNIDTNWFDVRVVERHIAEGRVTRKDYEQFLASLPDESEEGEETETRMTAPSPAEA
jgi:hypothetical protein